MTDRDLRDHERALGRDPSPEARARLEAARRRAGLGWPAAWGTPRPAPPEPGWALRVTWTLPPAHPPEAAEAEVVTFLRRVLPLLDGHAPDDAPATGEEPVPLEVGLAGDYAYGRRVRFGTDAAGFELRVETRGVDDDATPAWTVLEAATRGLTDHARLALRLELPAAARHAPGRAVLEAAGAEPALARLLDALPQAARPGR